MKKNININLFGTLYAIDEDACKLLENYLDNMRSYFAKRDGGDEIYDDIEHRVAEHLWNLKEQGKEAVDIETVKQVIGSIGNPSEVDGGENVSADGGKDGESSGADTSGGTSTEKAADTSSENSPKTGMDNGADMDTEAEKNDCMHRLLHHIRTHRFYRDGKDKVAGGVMSGFCHYCGGGDSFVWRIGAVLFVIVAFALNRLTFFMDIHPLFGFLLVIPFILYVAFWLLAPMARTAEERLCMKGADVTPEAISRAVIDEMDEQNAFAKERRHGNSVMSRIVEVVVFCFKTAGLVVFAVLLAFAVAYFVCGVIYAVAGVSFIQMFDSDPYFTRIISSIPMFGLYWILSSVCCVMAALLPLLGIVRSFSQKRKPLRFASSAMLVVLWIVSVVMGILLFVLFGIHASRERIMQDRADNTRNGVYLSRWTWDSLDEKGWVVAAAGNIAYNTLYGNYSEDPLKLDEKPFEVRPDRLNKPLLLDIRCKKIMAAGEYTLECLSHCSMSDAVLSAWSGGKCIAQLRLDGFEAADDRLLKDVSWGDSRSVQLLAQQTDSATWVDDVLSNAGEWHYLSSAKFYHGGGTVEYRLRIGQHDVADGSAMGGRVWVSHAAMRRQDK